MGSRNGAAETRRRRRAVFPRDNFTCRDCDVSATPPEGWNGEAIFPLTLGHIIPKADGGTGAIDNLICQCLDCNTILDNRRWVPGWRSLYPEIVEAAELRKRLRAERGNTHWHEQHRDTEWAEWRRQEWEEKLREAGLLSPSTPDDSAT